MTGKILSARIPLIMIAGPTASGKSDLALELANKINSNIISVDSAAIYESLDIGTAKPAKEVLKTTKHWCIDIIKPNLTFCVEKFRLSALNAMRSILNLDKNIIPIFAGGSMLYYDCILNGISMLPEANPTIRADITSKANKFGWKCLHEKLSKIDPIAAAKISANDSSRILRCLEVYYITNQTITELKKIRNNGIKHSEKYKYYLFVIKADREIIYKNIEARFKQMLKTGLIEETKNVVDTYQLNKKAQSMQIAGYKECLLYINGEINMEQLMNMAITNTRHIAKKQYTWINGTRFAEKIYLNYGDLMNTSSRKILINQMLEIINMHT